MSRACVDVRKWRILKAGSQEHTKVMLQSYPGVQTDIAVNIKDERHTRVLPLDYLIVGENKGRNT